MLKLLLTAGIPFQALVDQTSPTHRFINRQALAILNCPGPVRPPPCCRPALHAAVSDLLPQAQRSTAGFGSHFLNSAGVA